MKKYIQSINDYYDEYDFELHFDEVLEKRANESFDKLSEYIGKEVICSIWIKDELKSESGILKEVNDYDSIVLGDFGIPFIGYLFSIGSITCNGVEVYNNPFARIISNLDKIDDINFVKKHLYGSRILNIIDDKGYQKSYEK